jgi:hypothetical protein
VVHSVLPIGLARNVVCHEIDLSAKDTVIVQWKDIFHPLPLKERHMRYEELGNLEPKV